MKKIYLLPILFLILSSCSKDKKDPEPEPTTFIDSATLDLKYDKQHQFIVTKGTEVLDGSTLKWSSSDTLVGKVDLKGNFKGRKIGTTTVTGTVNGKTVESKITITPYSTTFKEPYLGFGSDVATVKANETRKFITQLTSSLSFEGDNSKIRAVLYLLDANNKMTSAGIFFENSSAMVTDVTTFFKERYPIYGSQDGVAVFFDDKNTIGIQLSANANLGFNAIYLPFLRTGRASSNFNEVSKQFVKALK
jgi:hypothetical protein